MWFLVLPTVIVLLSSWSLLYSTTRGHIFPFFLFLCCCFWESLKCLGRVLNADAHFIFHTWRNKIKRPCGTSSVSFLLWVKKAASRSLALSNFMPHHFNWHPIIFWTLPTELPFLFSTKVTKFQFFVHVVVMGLLHFHWRCHCEQCWSSQELSWPAFYWTPWWAVPVGYCSCELCIYWSA